MEMKATLETLVKMRNNTQDMIEDAENKVKTIKKEIHQLQMQLHEYETKINFMNKKSSSHGEITQEEWEEFFQ
jgi:archaellum component FlaC